MRHTQTSVLAAAVALVFATLAQAATVPGTVSRPATGPFITSAPRITSPAVSASSTTSNPTTTTTGTATAPTNTTSVDLRNQATLEATAGTHASGSTSALGPLANGTAGANTSTTGTTTGTTTGAIGTMPFLGTPIYANPSDNTLGIASPNAPASTGLASTDLGYGNASIAAQGIAVSETQVNGVNVDRAINQVSRDRKRIGRNGQLLYSIAPRTNVDRSAQMPDDGPSPALTGSNSTLAR